MRDIQSQEEQSKKSSINSLDSSQSESSDQDNKKQIVSSSQSSSSQFQTSSTSSEDQFKYLNTKAIEKYKSISKRNSKKNHTSSQQQQNQQQLIVRKQSKDEQTNSQQRQTLCLFKEYFPRQDKEYFLTNDVYIELDKNISNDLGFERYRALQNELRPISRIKHLKDCGFLILEFDEQKRGLTDFTILIEKLKRMQDQYFYDLAQIITLYNQLMTLSRQYEISVSPYERSMLVQRNKIHLQHYMTNTIPTILKPLDPSKFYVYFLYDMTEGFHNQTRKQYGMNERYINLFGSNVEEMTNAQLRQGWFNFTQYNNRNRQSIEYILNIKAVYENSFDFNSVQIDLNYDMLTIDNIKVPVSVVPNYNFCYSTTDFNPFTPNKPLMIGIFYLMEIVLQPHSRKMIRDIRTANKTQSIHPAANTNANLMQSTTSQNLSQQKYQFQQIQIQDQHQQQQQKQEIPFSNEKFIQVGNNNSVYTCDKSDKTIQSYYQSAEKFIGTFLSNKQSDNSIIQNSQHIYPEKTCKFISI